MYLKLNIPNEFKDAASLIEAIRVAAKYVPVEVNRLEDLRIPSFQICEAESPYSYNRLWMAVASVMTTNKTMLIEDIET
jgi:hypothetical protein